MEEEEREAAMGPYATVTIAQSRRLAECVTRFKSIATLNQTFNY